MASAGTIRDAKVNQVLRISVDDLPGHLETLEAELRGGRAVELMRGETVIAEVRAPEASVMKPTEETERYIPDFMGQMREIWGDTVFPEGTGTRWVREDRDARG